MEGAHVAAAQTYNDNESWSGTADSGHNCRQRSNGRPAQLYHVRIGAVVYLVTKQIVYHRRCVILSTKQRLCCTMTTISTASVHQHMRTACLICRRDKVLCLKHSTRMMIERVDLKCTASPFGALLCEHVLMRSARTVSEIRFYTCWLLFDNSRGLISSLLCCPCNAWSYRCVLFIEEARYEYASYRFLLIVASEICRCDNRPTE